MYTERQTEIINNSMELIANRGIQSFTIKNLSKSIGISEPAIYRHFENKISILIAILDNFKYKSSLISEKIQQTNISSFEKVELFFSNIIELFKVEPSFVTVIFSEEVFKNELILKDKIVEILHLRIRIIEEIIEDGQQKNEIRNDICNKTLALMLMGALRLRIKLWVLDENLDTIDQEKNSLISAIKNILKK